ncbi:MAG: CARDB domain-containing protein, partial [Candidatus Micrarchaeota archaeon]
MVPLRGTLSIFMLLALCASVFAYCGDGYCNETAGENYTNCPEDCNQNLKLVSVMFIPEAPEVDEEVQVEVTIMNDGNTTIGNNTLRYHADRIWYVGDWVENRPIEQMLPLEIRTEVFTYVPFPYTGAWGELTPNHEYITITADYYDDIEESNEMDNEITTELSRGFTGDHCGDGYCNETAGENYTNCPEDCDVLLPDLTITSMIHSPLQPMDGTLVSVYTTIMNIGDAPASGFTVATTAGPINNTCDNWVGFELDPNETYQVVCNYTASVSQNPNHAYSYVDAGNAVQESDELNNYMGHEIPIRTCIARWYCK